VPCIQGRGVLFHDGKREAFEPGEVMFVAAGTVHSFEDFTEDLAVWVVCYVPTGGEVWHRECEGPLESTRAADKRLQRTRR
jgi:mannose-6-phosphate isomerase-like protein (cupin superfamily)